jgi:hypothetical protein
LRQTPVCSASDETPTPNALDTGLLVRSDDPYSVQKTGFNYSTTSTEGSLPGFGNVAQLGMLMKFLLAAGILLFLGIGAAQAQSLSGVSSIGGGASINGASSVNHSPTINPGGSSTESVSDPRSSKSVEATNPGEFVPSTFESYDSALNLGEIANRLHSPSIVEAARLAQQAKANPAAKPALVLEKDADGNLIVVPATVPANVPATMQPVAPPKTVEPQRVPPAVAS